MSVPFQLLASFVAIFTLKKRKKMQTTAGHKLVLAAEGTVYLNARMTRFWLQKPTAINRISENTD
jgi:hypothetical protein